MTYSLKQQVIFDPSNQSAFGTLEAIDLTPVVQLDFTYGILSQTGISTTANSATIDTDASRLRLQSGTNTTGSAIFSSRKVAKYRAGQGMTARFTCVFGTGTASNTQIIGIGTASNGFFFGYNGTSFGILHRNGGSDTWVAQSSWNGDKADGTGASQFNWNKQLGNVMQIKYPYLGYGDVHFFVQDSNTGRFILVHTIKYANSSASTELSNPSMRFYVQNVNSGSSTNTIMYCGSCGIFISGVRGYAGNPYWCTDNSKTGITTETCIFNIRNATTLNGVTNFGLMRLNSVSLSGGNSTTNGIITLRMYIGSTIGGSPSYTPISGSTADNGVTITNGNAFASVDTAGTTVTGGTKIFTITSNVTGNTVIDLSPYDLFVAPTEVLTVSVASTTSATIGASLNWASDI